MLTSGIAGLLISSQQLTTLSWSKLKTRPTRSSSGCPRERSGATMSKRSSFACNKGNKYYICVCTTRKKEHAMPIAINRKSSSRVLTVSAIPIFPTQEWSGYLHLHTTRQGTSSALITRVSGHSHQRRVPPPHEAPAHRLHHRPTCS